MSGASREHWTSSYGFVLAAVGSAVGLGNMWRFSYLTAEKGGAAFVGFYLLFTAVVGIPVMLAELAIGRGSQRSPIQALAHYGGSGWKPLGVVFVAAGFLILAYYGVIAGWAVRYVGAAVLGSYVGDPEAYFFEEVAEGWDALGFHLAFLVATVLVVRGGVRGGIERVAGLIMPALFVLIIGIALYAATLDGAAGGYAYYLNVDVARVWDQSVVVEAAGQAFFSLSLGMGAILTFASYLSREHDLPRESIIIASADFGVAFIAGLMVFPLIYALGLQAGIIGQDTGTVGALFVALPKAFATMGTAGHVVGVAFFSTLVVGALTSAISLLEVVVSAAIDGLGWTRTRAAFVLGALATLLGAGAAFDINVLVAMDTVANKVFLIGGGLGLAIFTGWVMEDPAGEIAAPDGTVPAWFPIWRFLLRFVVPAVLLWVLWASAPGTYQAVAGLFS